MKGGLSDKTKVVVRHLPPTLTKEALMSQIDVVFSGRYDWASFRPGKASQKNQSYSRAYIDFRRPEDVIEFAEFFNGHLFVNEKGAQFEAIVEYAPSQHAPNQRSKKDAREGTIDKDLEYLEFLDLISKPVENLPSAEIQLERREAEKSGAPQDTPIITPLMDFVRQKRAAKSGSRRILSTGKRSRRAIASGTHSSSLAKRSSEKKRMSTTMYVIRDTAKHTGRKPKSTYVGVPKGDHQQLPDNAVSSGSLSRAEVLEEESGVSGVTEKKILLLKGKEKEISLVSGSFSQQQNLRLSDRSVTNSTVLKQNLRPEASGRMIRSILVNNDSCQNQSSRIQSQQQTQLSSVEKKKGKHHSRPVQIISKENNEISDGKVVTNDMHGFPGEKQEKRFRNRERPDRVARIPLSRSDGSYASEESLSSAASHSTQTQLEASQGSYKDFGWRGPPHITRDLDGSTVEGKPLKRGGNSGYGSHEKQVWVQKSSSCS